MVHQPTPVIHTHYPKVEVSYPTLPKGYNPFAPFQGGNKAAKTAGGLFANNGASVGLARVTLTHNTAVGSDGGAMFCYGLGTKCFFAES